MKDKLLSLDDLPSDAVFIIYELSVPVIASRSVGLATAFDPEPRTFPMASAFSYNSMEIGRESFNALLKDVSKERSKGSKTHTKTEVDTPEGPFRAHR